MSQKRLVDRGVYKRKTRHPAPRFEVPIHDRNELRIAMENGLLNERYPAPHDPVGSHMFNDEPFISDDILGADIDRNDLARQFKKSVSLVHDRLEPDIP